MAESTPSSSPAHVPAPLANAPAPLVPWQAVSRVWLEPQDAPGRVAVAATSVSGALALGSLLVVTRHLGPSAPLFPLLAWLSQHLAFPLWGFGMAGFLSQRRLPQALAYTSLAFIGIGFGARLLGLPVLPPIVTAVLHVTVGLLVAFPSALAQVWHRLRGHQRASGTE